MTKLTISLGQMDVRLGDVAANVQQAHAWTALAAERGSQLLLFPELWNSGCDWQHLAQHAAPLGSGAFAEMSDLAAEFRISVGGSMLEKRGEQVYNTFALYGSDGSLTGVYRKIHLFRLMDEHKWLAAGDSPTLADAPWGATGLAVCYDLRFAELFRLYALQGAQLALLPAEWPLLRVGHWRTLLQARAIENQMFVASVNRVGETDGVPFGGHSAIVDPWGEIVIEGGLEPALLTAEIDLARVAAVRETIPVFADRRADVYGDYSLPAEVA